MLSKITVVMVLYNATDKIFQCLDNIKSFNLIIINNGKTEKKLINRIKRYKNLIKFINSKKNLGYGRAANFALKFVKTEYSLMLGADVLVTEENVVELINKANFYNDAGIIVPTVFNENNVHDDYLENLPEFESGIKRNLREEEVNNKLSNKFIEGDTCINISWGAIWLLNNRIIKKIGFMDKNIFLYWEDFEVCRRLRFNKIPMIKIITAKATHYKSTGTKDNFVNYFIQQKYHILSSYYYFKVDKKSFQLKRKFFLYLFRSITYLLIFNFKKSLKNIARMCAIYSFVFKR
ncbi:glycosyltransferase family 2 protein [Candidatus Pelagibacter sp.]|nr:glycosyltransferase family 2 protein [Candidatus Pelagibacter sp.]MDA9646280.1 glycosyltransferase family 2 protein [Candidatus Pelagibacter sp.]